MYAVIVVVDRRGGAVEGHVVEERGVAQTRVAVRRRGCLVQQAVVVPTIVNVIKSTGR